MQEKSKQMNSGWLANVQLLPPWFLMKHFPVLDYKCIACEILISQKTQVFVHKYELRNGNSPLHILGQKWQMFVTFNSLKYSCTLFCFLRTSSKILQSSSDISKTLAKHRNCKKSYESFMTVFLRTS